MPWDTLRQQCVRGGSRLAVRGPPHLHGRTKAWASAAPGTRKDACSNGGHVVGGTQHSGEAQVNRELDWELCRRKRGASRPLVRAGR